MADKESDFMLKAFELAQKGAGLVSPNPMVGAVLVKEGRIVGEGYHLYDGLKHAETYAIEMAGEQARGATLYCNLEPCCHYGRTSPCTDALIEAGIARAVIATRDSDPRVSGRGIAQMEAAGITVEVGMYERKALRINECYFKYVTQRLPFVHGAVIYKGNDEGSSDEWNPSPEFLNLASEYDALVLGCEAGPNLALMEACLSRKRHRPPVIAGTPRALRSIKDFSQDLEEKNASVLIITDRTEGDLTENRIAVFGSLKEIEPVKPDLDSILRALARFRVTSCTVLANSREHEILGDLTKLDKLTIILPGSNHEEAIRSLGEGEDLVIGLDEVEYNHTGRHTEMVGYPRECDMDTMDTF